MFRFLLCGPRLSHKVFRKIPNDDSTNFSWKNLQKNEEKNVQMMNTLEWLTKENILHHKQPTIFMIII